MEKLCKKNITAKALAEDCEPDHDTIAAFISANHEAVKDLFIQILMQCAKLELIGEPSGSQREKNSSNYTGSAVQNGSNYKKTSYV
jgi:hypothetical protein